MNRDGVTTECVNGQQVEILRLTTAQFTFHGKAGVARDYFQPGPAILQVTEIPRIICDSRYLGIDLVKANVVSRVSVDSQSACPEAHNADAEILWIRPGRQVGLECDQGKANAAGDGIVTGRRMALCFRAKLVTVGDSAVEQGIGPPVGLVRGKLANAKHP